MIYLNMQMGNYALRPTNLMFRNDHFSQTRKLSRANGAFNEMIEDRPGGMRLERLNTEDLKISPNIFVSLRKGKVSDAYKVLKLLGEGAYGKVYQIQHKKTNICRAMKSKKAPLTIVLRKKHTKNIQKAEVFNEFEILRNVDHPNIVNLYELYGDDHYYFLISEYLEGGELFDRIKTAKHFSEGYAAKIMHQLLSAVNYLHIKGIVHRDLKPENILFTSKDINSAIKVIDFGVSDYFDPQTKFNDKQGTVNWWSNP